MQMITEIGAGVGGAITFGAAMTMFKFLNNKIDKKQDKTMCEEVVKNFTKAIDKSDLKHKETMTILNQIQVATGKIEQELKHFNGKT